MLRFDQRTVGGLMESVSVSPRLDLRTAAAQEIEATFAALGTTAEGLTSVEAAERLRDIGPNVLASRKVTVLGVLGRQLRNPLLILLLSAALVSGTTGDPTDAV